MNLAERLRQEGWQEGIQQVMQTAAKQMLNEGTDIEFISRVTNLTITEILNLQKEELV